MFIRANPCPENFEVMFQKLDQVEERFQEIEQLLADPKTLGNPKEMQKLARERAEISKLVETYQVYKKVKEEIQQSQELLQETDEECGTWPRPSFRH